MTGLRYQTCGAMCHLYSLVASAGAQISWVTP